MNKQNHTSQVKSFATKFTRSALAFVLAFAMCFPLAGCKDTDVLTQLIIDQSAPIDESLEPITAHESEGQNEGSANEAEEDSSQIPEDETEPSYGEDSSNEEIPNEEHSDLTGNQDTATSGNEDGSGQGQASSSDGNAGEKGTDPDDNAGDLVSVIPNNGNADSEKQDPEDTGKNTPGGNSTIGDSSNGGGQGGKGAVYADGTYATLPESKSIAAAGTYAVLVQMLGGAGALACTDATTLSNFNRAGAFPGELDNVKVGWSTDGSSLAGDIDIDAIVASGADTVLTSASYGGITTNEIAAKLTERGVNVVEMPVLGVNNSLDEQIVIAVNVVGEMLKKSGHTVNGKTSDQMAATWRTLHSNTLESYLKAAGGYSTTVITGGSKFTGTLQGRAWYVLDGSSTNTYINPNVIYTTYINAWANTGETTKQGNRNGPTFEIYGQGIGLDSSDGLAYLLGTDSSISTSQFYLLAYYFQNVGVSWTDGIWGADSLGSWDSGEHQYQYMSMSINGVTGYQVADSYNNFLTQISTGLRKDSYALLGADSSEGYGASYPGVVVRDAAQKDAMLASSQKEYGFYNYGTSYDIYILPSSTLTGSWESGSPESFITTVWAYCMFRNGGNLQPCTDLINEYCSTFYRCGASSVISGDYGSVYKAGVSG